MAEALPTAEMGMEGRILPAMVLVGAQCVYRCCSIGDGDLDFVFDVVHSAFKSAFTL